MYLDSSGRRIQRDMCRTLWILKGVPRAQHKLMMPYRLPKEGETNVLITSALPYCNNMPHLGWFITQISSATNSNDSFRQYYWKYSQRRRIQSVRIFGSCDEITSNPVSRYNRKQGITASLSGYQFLSKNQGPKIGRLSISAEPMNMGRPPKDRRRRKERLPRSSVTSTGTCTRRHMTGSSLG